MSLSSRFLVIAIVLIWGFNFVVIRWGLEGTNPVMMTVLRFLLTAFPIIFFIKKPEIPLKILALYGILFGAGIWGLVNLAVSINTPSGLVSLLLQLSVFLTLISGLVFFKEKISARQVVAILVASVGFLVVCLFQSDSVSLNGMLLVFLAALCWTICNIIIKHYKPKEIVGFVAYSSLFVPFFVLIFHFGYLSITGKSIDWQVFFELPNAKGWISIAFQSYITTLFGYGVWTLLITKNGLSNIAPYSLLVPISGLFFGWFFYQETLSKPVAIGCLLVACGLMLLSVKIPLLNRKHHKKV